MGGTLALLGHHDLFDRLLPLTVVAAALAAGVLLLTSPTRRRDLLLLPHSLVLLAIIWLVMWLRPGFHPRYVFLARAVVGVASLSRWKNVPAWVGPGAALLLVALLPMTGLTAYAAAQTEPRYQRDDVRALTRRLQETAAPDDVILLDYIDYAFQHTRARLPGGLRECRTWSPPKSMTKRRGSGPDPGTGERVRQADGSDKVELPTTLRLSR